MNTNSLRALADFFAAEEIDWKPQVVSGNRALAVAYIDARSVMARLDDAVGPENWKDEYFLLPDGHVECRLSVRVYLEEMKQAEWVTKADIGSQAGSDAADRLKGGFSDSLKRAAVKWGVGRYLYNLPLQWVDYDPQKRQFIEKPQIPDKFLPPPPVCGAVLGKELYGLCVRAAMDPAVALKHYQVADFNLIPRDKYAALKQRFLRGVREVEGNQVEEGVVP